MGTGKTSVGRELAAMLGLRFVDTDTEIVRSSGRSIAEIFAESGEADFRRMERSVCEKIVADGGDIVVSTGGGTLVDDGLYRLFAERGAVVLLEASLDVLCQRLDSDGERPLLAADGSAPSGAELGAKISKILAERADAYRRVGMRVDTSERTTEQTAARVAALLDLPATSLDVNPMVAVQQRPDEDPLRGRYGLSRIELGRGVLSRLGPLLREMGLTTHAFLIMPPVTTKYFLEQLAASLGEARIPHSVIEIEDGDPKKNLLQVEAIVDKLIEHGARRDATVIPVGGGVTGDIGGFAASLFMRGVPLVQIPTTLLAQVDSSIGGKVGVNHPLAKNLIGAFYQAHLVLSDPCTLRTLPIEEISNGMAEVVKAALIDDEAFFEYLEREASKDASERLRDIAFLEKCAFEAARIKCRIVNEDPYERDRRRTLNLGHTVGHALEASTHYTGLKHGQAVSLGLLAAMRIAEARGALGHDILDRTRALLTWCGLPVVMDAFDRETVVRSLSLDKKIRNGRIHFVLPTGIGSADVIDDVTVDEIVAAMEGGMQ